jgi:hypothetical protein
MLLGCGCGGLGGGLTAVFGVEVKDVPAVSGWVKKT